MHRPRNDSGGGGRVINGLTWFTEYISGWWAIPTPASGANVGFINNSKNSATRRSDSPCFLVAVPPGVYSRSRESPSPHLSFTYTYIYVYVKIFSQSASPPPTTTTLFFSHDWGFGVSVPPTLGTTELWWCTQARVKRQVRSERSWLINRQLMQSFVHGSYARRVDSMPIIFGYSAVFVSGASPRQLQHLSAALGGLHSAILWVGKIRCLFISTFVSAHKSLGIIF